MIKEIGRLDAFETQKIEDHIDEIFTLLDQGVVDKAIEMLADLCKTNNYYLREMVGKLLTKYKDQKKMDEIANDMLTRKVYGIRATALFYFFKKYINKPDMLISLLENNYDSTPWEVESIIYELWKKNPKINKKMSPMWLDAEDEKKRMISFHGLELIVEHDTLFVLDFLSKAIDDPSLEVQKKITHILLQIVKTRPAETYAYLREWILTGSEQRIKFITLTLKKIVSLYAQKNNRDKSHDFMTLTKTILHDWKSEHNKKVASVGKKLENITKKEHRGQ